MFTHHKYALRTVQRRGRVRLVRPGETRSGAGHSLLLLSALFVFNAFDLALTQSQIPRGNFNEMNVLAAAVTDCPYETAAYKIVLFSAGAIVLAQFRRHRVTQIGLAALTACYGGLMVWWQFYLSCVEFCLSDPASISQLLPL